jgi:hypothetical protein
MIAPEGFQSAGLDTSVMFGTLQCEAHQHNIKLELEEVKCEITSVPVSSLQATPNDASSTEAYHHHQVQTKKLRV